MRSIPMMAVRGSRSIWNERLLSATRIDLTRVRSISFLAIVALTFLVGGAALAQESGDSQSESAVCTFEDGRQMSVRYAPVPLGRGDLPFGKVWMPSGSALTLFTETDVALNGKTLPVGAYTMYLIPAKKNWTVIVSRNTGITNKYDEKDDLARATMESGELSQSEKTLKVFFGHTGPKICEFNVDFGKTRTWAEFKEK